jgi:ATP-binding cassette, subfamily B (MDR/TAP), member 1
MLGGPQPGGDNFNDIVPESTRNPELIKDASMKTGPSQIVPQFSKTASVMKRKQLEEMDEESKAMLTKANDLKKVKDDANKELIKDLVDPKTQNKLFYNKLSKFAEPKLNIAIGTILSLISGLIAPLYGYLLVKNIFGMFLPPGMVLDNNMKFIIYMMIGAGAMFVTKALTSICFAYVSENITLNVRVGLYSTILHRHIGWHDHKTNSSGVMSSTLAQDAQTLNGASSEGVAVQIESTAALLWGIGLAAYFSWPICVVGVILSPFIIIASAASAKMDNKQFFNIDDEEGNSEKKASEILVGDSIQNYKVVQSFGHDELIVEEFDEMSKGQLLDDIAAGKKFGCAWGFSQAVQNMCFGLMYLASAEIQVNFPDIPSDPEDMFLALFAIMFGAFTAGQASQFGPDIAKAKAAGQKIFSIMELKSEINVSDPEESSKMMINTETFRGEIEFKDVWFRYPTRLNHWVLKGLNLKINSNERIALVGESG